MLEPEIYTTESQRPAPFPKGRRITPSVVRVTFDNPSKVKFRPEWRGSSEYRQPFSIFDEAGRDTGYVGCLLPGSLAQVRYFRVDKYKRVQSDVLRDFAGMEGKPTDGFISSMYVPKGACANTRIVAGLLKFCYPNFKAPANFDTIYNGFNTGAEIVLPPLEEAREILKRGIDGIPFDDYAELRHVLTQEPWDITDYDDEWLNKHNVAPDDWFPQGTRRA